MVLPVVYQLITMIIIMCMGIVLYKRNNLNDDTAKGLSITLTRIAVPCNMIVLLQREFTTELFQGFILVCKSTLFMLIIISIILFFLAKLLKFDLKNTGLFMSGGAYSNVIFMGQPLILAMYGEEALFYCTAVMITSNIYLFTACSVFFAMGSDKKKTILEMIKDVVCNTIFLSAILGIGMFILNISLPQPVYDALSFCATTTVCLSMIYIGTLLASADIKEVFKDKTVYIFSLFSLIVTPILAKFILGESGLNMVSGLPLDVIVVLFGTPAAAALPSFAEMYGSNAKRASEYVFVSTILSLITLPLIVQILF